MLDSVCSHMEGVVAWFVLPGRDQREGPMSIPVIAAQINLWAKALLLEMSNNKEQSTHRPQSTSTSAHP